MWITEGKREESHSRQFLLTPKHFYGFAKGKLRNYGSSVNSDLYGSDSSRGTVNLW